jgi:hypothetical protein
MTTQQPSTIVDHSALTPHSPHRYPTCDRKSTQLPDFFFYSTYSFSFAYFLTCIHSFSEPSFYKEVILNPFW